MKFTVDKTYLKYSIYIVLTATVLYILYEVVANIGSILTATLNVLSGLATLLAPFIIAFVIAYLLHPVVDWIERYIMGNKTLTKLGKNYQIKRTLSVLLTYILIISFITLFIYSTYVMIGGEITKNLNIENMIESISEYASRYEEIFSRLSIQLDKSGISDDIKQQLKQLVTSLRGYLSSAVNETFDFTKKLGGNILNIFLGLIISFYMLKDIKYFNKLYSDTTKIIFKKRTNDRLYGFFGDVNTVVSGFIRGQLLDGIIVGILISIGLALIGLDFPILIGMTAGIANIIPYFGPVIGTVPAVIMGLLSGSPIKAFFAILVMFAVQQLDGAIISPKVVGESVGLHPVFVILSIIVGGAYMGLLGMLIAVPTAGIIKLFIIRWLNYRKHNSKSISG